MLIKNNDIILFQGNSITDAGRKYSQPDDMGWGYATIAAGLFAASHPEINAKFLNRGISGNRAINLKERWQEDCIDLNPTIISIMIGINDCWRRYDSNDLTTAEDFEKYYKYILDEIKDKLTAKLILIEPFVLPYPDDRKQWREDLDPKIEIVNNLAKKFKTVLVPLDKIMNKASKIKSPDFWTGDGVHPTHAGHSLIAKSWLEAVEA